MPVNNRERRYLPAQHKLTAVLLHPIARTQSCHNVGQNNLLYLVHRPPYPNKYHDDTAQTSSPAISSNTTKTEDCTTPLPSLVIFLLRFQYLINRRAFTISRHSHIQQRCYCRRHIYLTDNPFYLVIMQDSLSGCNKDRRYRSTIVTPIGG